jgi:hypothetical protein
MVDVLPLTSISALPLHVQKSSSTTRPDPKTATTRLSS